MSKRVASISAICAMSFIFALNVQAQDFGQVAARDSNRGAPIYTLLAYRPTETTHLADLDDNLIVAQIASFTDRVQARLFIEAHSKLELIGVRLVYGDTIHYTVILGVYEDEDNARWAHEAFAEDNPRFLRSNFKRMRLGALKRNILR